SHPGNAAGSRKDGRCSTSCNHTFWPMSSMSTVENWNRRQMFHTRGANRLTISFHALLSLSFARDEIGHRDTVGHGSPFGSYSRIPTAFDSSCAITRRSDLDDFPVAMVAAMAPLTVAAANDVPSQSASPRKRSDSG